MTHSAFYQQSINQIKQPTIINPQTQTNRSRCGRSPFKMKANFFLKGKRNWFECDCACVFDCVMIVNGEPKISIKNKKNFDCSLSSPLDLAQVLSTNLTNSIFTIDITTDHFVDRLSLIDHSPSLISFLPPVFHFCFLSFSRITPSFVHQFFSSLSFFTNYF